MPPQTVAAKIVRVYEAKDGDASFRGYAVSWNGQEVVVSEMFYSHPLYKEGDTVKIAIRKMGTKLLILLAPDVKIPVYPPTPVAVQSNRKAVFFECRGNEVFYIDGNALRKNGADANYTVDPGRKAIGLLSLVPKEGVHGDGVSEVGKPNSKLQAILKTLDPKKSYLAFLEREDSAEIAKKAKDIAEAAGFEVLEMPLPKAKPVNLGSDFDK